MKQFFTLCITLGFLWAGAANATTLWIDVRSEAEYQQDHIEGDLNIPHSELPKKIGLLAPDKDTDIVLYCRSGGRAGRTKLALEKLGYTKVSNAGGLNDARLLRLK